MTDCCNRQIHESSTAGSTGPGTPPSCQGWLISPGRPSTSPCAWVPTKADSCLEQSTRNFVLLRTKYRQQASPLMQSTNRVQLDIFLAGPYCCPSRPQGALLCWREWVCVQSPRLSNCSHTSAGHLGSSFWAGQQTSTRESWFHNHNKQDPLI